MRRQRGNAGEVFIWWLLITGLGFMCVFSGIGQIVTFGVLVLLVTVGIPAFMFALGLGGIFKEQADDRAKKAKQEAWYAQQRQEQEQRERAAAAEREAAARRQPARDALKTAMLLAALGELDRDVTTPKRRLPRG